ncbi:MAG: uroporphyrinogen-III synthase [Bacteroidetes bacterium]|nr:uroporphyrinogen-III synthase [Bacteroidota bacterium]
MAANNIHILSTRFLNEELVEKATLHNLFIDAEAFIQNIPDVTAETEEVINALSRQPITAVFTSIHAVEVVKSELGIIPPWKIFSTGGATKEALLDIFDESSIIATAKNASGLAEKILQHNDIRKIIFFCGKQRLNDLPENLQASGVDVREIIVYQTIGTPKTIHKHYQGILFFSPSGAHSFFSVNTIPLSTIIFSIGKTTTATVESYCSNPVITSQWPGEANLVELVIDHFKKTTGIENKV